jgi:iron(III) transport system ATP-binding protein
LQSRAQVRPFAMVNVCIDSISKSYGDGPLVLRNINLRIEAGELFFLLGPSGCGKTTLLRLIAGFLEPSSGSLRFGDKEVHGLPAEKRGTAMVFQNYALWPHMTVAQNVGFGLEVQRVAADERQKRIMEALEMVGLAEFADRKVPSLSGGQQQRVALARAIVVRPQVLLLDEPLSNLDAKLRIAMRLEIRRICKATGLTAIYVTHEQKEALSMADRMAILHEGNLEQVGAPREIYTEPRSKFVAEFIGESNFVPCTILQVEGQQVVADSVLGHLRGRLVTGSMNEGDSALLSIRPEAIRLSDGIGAHENGFSAELSSLVYLGEVGQWQLQAAGLPLKVFELHPKSRAAGERVTCEVDPQDVIVLPAG